MTNVIQKSEILLHICCGPCAEWPVDVLQKEGFALHAFYYNPNIHPSFEYERRKENAEKLMNLRSIPFSSDDQNLESMWRENGWEDEYASRCEMCYDLRIMRTAMEAKARGIPYFSTTLLVSIYQNHDAIVRAGEKAAKQTGTSFLYRDFRDGFREGQEMAKSDGLYRQKYCGCILSLEESAYKEKIYQSFSGRSGDTRSV